MTRSGRQWKGLCPFHKEDSPSFLVDEAKQTFYCHGCGAGGGFRALAAALLGEASLASLPPARPRPPKPRPELTPWGGFAPNAEMAVRDLLATRPSWCDDRTAEAEAWARWNPIEPIGGWAPGNYICKCSSCEDYFPGAKLCTTCYDCATKP